MTQMEYLKTVKRKCACNSFLVWYKKEYKSRIRARGHWMNDFAQLLLGASKYKNKHCYNAECAKCGKYYFTTSTKKEMIENLKYLGMGYKEKEAQQVIQPDN